MTWQNVADDGVFAVIAVGVAWAIAWAVRGLFKSGNDS